MTFLRFLVSLCFDGIWGGGGANCVGRSGEFE